MTPTIAFLGCGSMSEAILAGLLATGFSPHHVRATVRTRERAAWLAERHGVAAVATDADPDANRAAAGAAGLVVLGVKPALVRPVAVEIASALDPQALVLSVAGAVPLASVESALPAGQPVVRAMPNTPSRIGYGVTALAAGAHASAADRRRAHDLFTTVGWAVEVPEEQIDAVGTLSGSGPAYVFYLTEAMAEAGVRLGLPAELARELAARTVAGAGRMLVDGADPTALRRAVSSPQGSTERAIATFEQRGLPDIVAAGAAAAAARTAEITRELG
ncbi:pyrroline-5-carboxylate reductase [Nocardioides sp. R1-1]|uniref:pyrroline-5-carboxylate reductase n=1 Tax=Nocardioides sp. R1-1 TaxID=3383502 RepID=UPI0038D17073